jgi:hypothetical protein
MKIMCLHATETESVIKRGSRDSSLGVATGYEVDGRGSIPGRSKRFFSTPRCPDRLWASYAVDMVFFLPGT